MLVKDFMKRKVLFVHPDDSIRNAPRLMSKGVMSKNVVFVSEDAVDLMIEPGIKNYQ